METDERPVSTLELFFDLVFVFGITQVTAYLAENHTPMGFVEGLLLLALLWSAWTGFTWTGSAADISSGHVRLVMFSVMAGLLVVAMGMPEWFHDAPDGFTGILDGPVVVALAYVSVRVGHLALFAIVGHGTPELLQAVARFSTTVLIAAVLVVTGAVVGGTWQVVLVATAVVLDYLGALLGRGGGWVVTPGHFAERHGLIIIIALGESIVAIGAGAAGLALSWPLVLVACLGVAVAARLWVIYFDPFAQRLEHELRSRSGPARAQLARDAYTYGHLLLVAGIVLIALGLKKAIFSAGDYGLGQALPLYAGLAFGAGIAVYLVGRQIILLRAGCSWEPHTVGAAVVALALIPFVSLVPAVAVVAGGIAILIAGGRQSRAIHRLVGQRS